MGSFITECSREGWLDEHLALLRQEYPARRRAMISALCEHVPLGMRWDEPAGGFYLWCRLRGELRAKDLLVEAARRQVAFVAGEPFYTDGEGQDALRLNFTARNEVDIQEGIRRLGEALTALARRQQHRQGVHRETLRPIV